MTPGKEKKKSTIKYDNGEREKGGRGKAELRQTAETKQKNKSKIRSASLNADSADVDVRSDDADERLIYIILTIQRYEGGECEGKFHGEGVACFEGGHVYKGTFSMGLMDGRGVFTHAGGLKYEGDFVRNQPMGRGTYTWPDGSSYEGEVYNGVRHGTGTFKCAKNVTSYTGQWDQGKRHGKGAIYHNQDQTSWYKGDWVNNVQEGCGVRCYPSGNLYSGEWKNNQMHGEGKMNWLNLGEQYTGMWQNGVQHGRGTHIWTMRQATGCQYGARNQFTGDFFQGQMHGRGILNYANGVTYEGEWSNNKRCLKGKYTFRNGRVFEGELADDQMMAQNRSRNGAHLYDMALNIQQLLDLIPERDQDTELEQVEFIVLRHGAELRSIYTFYSRLGHANSPDNVFTVNRLQFWRLLKDCNIHHHVSRTQLDHLIREDATAAEISFSPFTMMPLNRFLSCLVAVAYHIYHKDMASQKDLLASCFSKLILDHILPNAKNVKGFLFRESDCSEAALIHLQKCWEIYQAYCKDNAAPRDDGTITCRHLLCMFKDLHLLDNSLTTQRLLDVVTAEGFYSFEVQITFLEFFEVLLGSAEIKCQPVSGVLEPSQSLPSPQPEVEASENISGDTNSSAQLTEKTRATAESPTAEVQDVEGQQEASDQPQAADPAEKTGESRGEEKDVQPGGTEAKGREEKLSGQMIHQFFNRFFFPAFEHNQFRYRK